MAHPSVGFIMAHPSVGCNMVHPSVGCNMVHPSVGFIMAHPSVGCIMLHPSVGCWVHVLLPGCVTGGDSQSPQASHPVTPDWHSQTVSQSHTIDWQSPPTDWQTRLADSQSVSQSPACLCAQNSVPDLCSVSVSFIL